MRAVLRRLMTEPVFPVPIDILAAKLEFTDFRPGETLRPAPGIKVRSAALNRTVRITGYRVEHGGKSVGYISDLIAGPDGDKDAAQSLLEGVDLAVVSTAETSAEPADWRHAVRLCEDAGAGTCVVFHHHPVCDDAAMDAIAAEAQALRPGTIVAVEGTVLTP